MGLLFQRVRRILFSQSCSIFINLYNLSQYNFVVTNKSKIVDLVFSNSDVSVNYCSNPLVPENPYHPALCVSANFVRLHPLKSRPYTKHFYQSGDYDSINSKLNETDWNIELRRGSLIDAVSFSMVC